MSIIDRHHIELTKEELRMAKVVMEMVELAGVNVDDLLEEVTL